MHKDDQNQLMQEIETYLAQQGLSNQSAKDYFEQANTQPQVVADPQREAEIKNQLTAFVLASSVTLAVAALHHYLKNRAKKDH